MGRLKEARDALQQALIAAVATGDDYGRACALGEMAQALAQAGAAEAAAVAAQQALTATEVIEDARGRAESLGLIAQALTGSADRVLSVLVEAYLVTRSAGRESANSVLGEAVPTLVRGQRDQVLKDVYEQVVEVESWFGL